MIAYHLHDDNMVFRQKVHQIENLHLTVNRCFEQKYEEERRHSKKPKDIELEMEVIKIADLPETAVTAANTTTSSFNSDLQHFIEGNTKFGTKMPKKI